MFLKLNQRGRIGFTLVEVIIAGGILAAFMGGAFWVYTSSAQSMIGGSWRLAEQKRAQNLLAQWTKDLGRATEQAIQIASNGAIIPEGATPIYVNRSFYAQTPAASVSTAITGNTWTCLMIFSITDPRQEENTDFRIDGKRGRWTGISLWGRGREVRYIRSDRPELWQNLPAVGVWPAAVVAPVPTGGVAVGGNYEPAAEGVMNTALSTEVERVGFYGRGKPEGAVLEITLHCRKYNGTVPSKPDLQFSESLSVKLATGTVTLFP